MRCVVAYPAAGSCTRGADGASPPRACGQWPGCASSARHPRGWSSCRCPWCLEVAAAGRRKMLRAVGRVDGGSTRPSASSQGSRLQALRRGETASQCECVGCLGALNASVGGGRAATAQACGGSRARRAGDAGGVRVRVRAGAEMGRRGHQRSRGSVWRRWAASKGVSSS